MSRTPARRQACGQAGDLAGVGDEDAGGPLDEGLDDDGGQLAGVAVDGGHRLVGPARVVVAGGADDREADGIEETGAETAVAQREGTDGVAVVGVAQGQIAGAALDAEVDPVLEGDLQGLLDRRGAVGGEEEVGGVHRDHGGQGLGQLHHHPVAVAEQGGVGDQVELTAERGVELGDAVAEGGDPERGDGVEITAAVDVDQLPALAVVDDDRGVVAVGRHLGEAVPDDGRVAGHPVARVPGSSGAAGPGVIDIRPGRGPGRPRPAAAFDVGRVDPAALEDGGGPESRRRGPRRPGRGRPLRRWPGWRRRRCWSEETMSAARAGRKAGARRGRRRG